MLKRITIFDYSIRNCKQMSSSYCCTYLSQI